MAHERIESFLKRKWLWLEKQLKFFKQYHAKQYQKEYLSGESFLYLGRQYKLLVRERKEDKVILGKGQLVVYTSRKASDVANTKKLLSEWYKQRMKKVFHQRYKEILPKFDYKIAPQLITREMQKRWGSFLGKQKIILNPTLIYTPKECIDYVIAHELCHLTHKKHDKQFFKLLESKHPKWGKIKNRLEIIGAQSLNYLK